MQQGMIPCTPFPVPVVCSFKLASGWFLRRLFSGSPSPENDTDETLTTSGVSHGDCLDSLGVSKD